MYVINSVIENFLFIVEPTVKATYKIEGCI